MAETVASTDVALGSGKRALAVLFFLHAAAMAAYTVPLANVLKARSTFMAKTFWSQAKT